MPFRSVAELLPRPFSEMELADLEEVVRRVGEERETIFFERKAVPEKAAIAKACAAFANTLGGLLLVGLGDDASEISGFAEPHIGDPSVWIKDVLRGRVTPLPPFRARAFDLENGNQALAVLVERSSTTPHLLTRQGAIYVRTPGASEPVGLSDQRTLMELVARGDSALVAAEKRALAARDRPPDLDYVSGIPFWGLTVAPTGSTEETEISLAYDERVPEWLAALLPPRPEPRMRSQAQVKWEQDCVTVYRVDALPWTPAYHLESVTGWRSGTIDVRQGGVVRDQPARHPLENFSLSRRGFHAWLDGALMRVRDLLLDVGAHGDLRVLVRMHAGIELEWEKWQTVESPIDVEKWVPADASDERLAETLQRIEWDLDRAFGRRPSAPSP